MSAAAVVSDKPVSRASVAKLAPVGIGDHAFQLRMFFAEIAEADAEGIPRQGFPREVQERWKPSGLFAMLLRQFQTSGQR